MARRRSSRDSYKSLGMFKNVSRKWIKAVKREKTAGERIDNQWDAFVKGKNVILTVLNPNKNETHKKFIKVKAKNYWRDPNIKPKKENEWKRNL